MPRMLLVPLTLLAAGCTAYAGGYDSAAADPAAAQAKVDEAVAGRVAGTPVQCVPNRDVESKTSLTSDLMLFRVRGDVVYLNQTRGPCNLKPWAAWKRQTISPNLCSGEIIDVFDPRSGVPLGSCSLGEFTPYTRSG